MGIEMNTSLQAFAARHTNEPQLLQSSIVVNRSEGPAGR